MYLLTSASRTAISIAAAALAFCAIALPGTASADPDLTPPVVTITGFPSANDSAGTFLFVADEPVQGFQCQLDGGSWLACVAPTFVNGLQDGPHTFGVRATDLAGNLSDPPALHAWTVDTVAPAAPQLTAPASGTWTNVTQPTITGTAEANSTVRVFDGTTLIGSTVADANGDWNFSPPAPLADGTYSIRARARDAATNESVFSTARTLYIDTQPPPAPQILVPAEGGLTNGPELVVSGTTEPFATIAVEIDSSPVGSGAADSSGNWSVVPSPVPDDGSHTVTAVATDRAGNVGTASSSVSFDLESVPPPAPELTSPADDSAFATAELLFVGTAEQWTTIRLFRDGTQFASGTTAPNGSWSVTASLPDGLHEVTVTAEDEYGNESAPSAPTTITIDTTPPVAQIVDGPSTPTNQTAAPFTFSADESNVLYECSLDLGTWTTCTNPVTFTVAEGPHQLSVRATDQLGNVGAASAPYEWTVDVTPPAAPIVVSPAGGAKLTDPRPVISGTAEQNSQLDVLVDGNSVGTVQAAPSGSWQLALTADLDQGESAITAVATDAAGNSSTASAPVTVSVDSIAPTTSFTSGPPPIWDATTAGFLFGADEADVTFRCRLDGAPWAECSSPFLVTGLRYGGHLFEVYGVDDFGNTEPTVRAWEWRTAQSQPDATTDATCRFRRAPIGPIAAISRIRVDAKGASRPVVAFNSNRLGIARVTIVRGRKELARTDIEADRGSNFARLKLSRKARKAGRVSISVSSVSLGAGFMRSTVAARIDKRGRLTIAKRTKPRDGTGCSSGRVASQPPKLSFVGVGPVNGGSLSVTVTSDQLTVVRARAEDGDAGADSETEIIAPRKQVTLVVQIPPGLGDPGTKATVHVVGFNAALAQTAVSAPIPGS